jgi:2-C-methyl-D-erythritol 4-phosphate cytidylyltransferase
MNYWIIIPAAGIGKRMGTEIPKQYLKLGEQTVLEHTIQRFQNLPQIKGIVVCIAPDDLYFEKLAISKQVMITNGGKERCDSVLNGLKYLEQYAEENDWILVHDAARPCVRKSDIEKLMFELQNHEVGGLLAVPVRDTMKRAKNQCVEMTINRENLWHALTPQMFRFKILKTALETTLEKQQIITDEAQAVEFLGLSPMLIEGHADNIKITHPNDLQLATLFISNLLN